MVPLTNTSALLAHTSSIQWKLQRGFFVDTGSISVDQRHCACGGQFIKSKFREQNYFKCASCGKEPTLYRVRRYLPGDYGSAGKMHELRYDHNGVRITEWDQAIAFIAHMKSHFKSGKTDATEFKVKAANNNALFENFVNNVYLPHYEKKVASGSYKPSSMAAKKQYLRNYLVPYFSGHKEVKDKVAGGTQKVIVDWASKVRSIKMIHEGTIECMYVDLPCSERMKDLVCEELRALLNFAFRMRLIDRVPSFPKMKKPQLKNPDSFLSSEKQKLVLDHVDDFRYKKMLSIMCLVAIRPSEVRALKWSDWDYKANKLWIKRHVTFRSKVVPGRKSKDTIHFIALSPELTSIIEDMPRPINQGQYMFPGDKQEIVSEHCLSRAWKKAMRCAGLPHVDSYRGSKSSCMSNWLQKGYSISQIAAFTGLTEEDVRRYAQRNDENIHKLQMQMMEG
jgi:integrase